MPKKTKTALSEDGRDPLLLGHLAYGGVALLLHPDRNPQDDLQASDHKDSILEARGGQCSPGRTTRLGG